MTTFPSNEQEKTIIKPFDIFLADKICEFENNTRHYYVCVYSQALDENNTLTDDIYGLIISTNPKYEKIKNDYNVRIYINGVKAFVCCDKLVRMKVDENVALKTNRLKEFQIKLIKKYLDKFLDEMKRQIKDVKL